ncbi:hypothetical protein DL762_000225 [Monosporascus cannonballus]|uniref:Uncharacterized protein n=1 Tax=Monosporascus cannonballus TaxID=155416 RepID=A0ABY0HK75_9PEZI|nr:hypothetical protein DL762_000225 [Monosporascus cannonballus]
MAPIVPFHTPTTTSRGGSERHTHPRDRVGRQDPAPADAELRRVPEKGLPGPRARTPSAHRVWKTRVRRLVAE